MDFISLKREIIINLKWRNNFAIFVLLHALQDSNLWALVSLGQLSVQQSRTINFIPLECSHRHEKLEKDRDMGLLKK